MQWSTSSMVTGKVYAFDYADPTPTNLTTAVGDMHTAYTDANSRAADFTDVPASDIGGTTLAPGVYKYTTALLINSTVYLDANNDANAVWIFQVASDITMASDIRVNLINGAQAQNIFWALGGQMTIGTNSHFEGNILSYTAINFQTAASFIGKALAQTGVTLDANAINDSDVPLPITLASFSGKVTKAGVLLEWQTATETDNARFVIYRDGEAIGSVDGAGTTSEPHNYSFVDKSVVPGVTYTYVLADIDYANEETRYNNDAVTVTVANDLVDVDFVVRAAYPNPFNPSTVVPVELKRDAMVKASLYDLNGRVVKALVNATFTAGTHELRIDGSNLITGLYLVQVVVDNVVDVQKIALMK
ncbi:MAG: ice-binding family protein [Candidatus Marinimicrobia bacterium]|nr:ice-binding family protein [Candidatus Neomarinimicrobiota bacterium]